MRAIARQFKRGVRDFYWMVRGPSLRAPAPPSNPRSVLFVCKGNICRSPFAERLAAKLGREEALPRIKFGSAGLHVRRPLPSPDNAIEVAKRFGVDLDDHRSQPISPDLVESYDMIVAMEVWQYTELRSSFPCHEEKMFLLPLLVPNSMGDEQGYAAYNIPDPYGGPASVFERCFDRISRSVNNAFIPSDS